MLSVALSQEWMTQSFLLEVENFSLRFVIVPYSPIHWLHMMQIAQKTGKLWSDRMALRDFWESRLRSYQDTCKQCPFYVCHFCQVMGKWSFFYIVCMYFIWMNKILFTKAKPISGIVWCILCRRSCTKMAVSFVMLFFCCFGRICGGEPWH